MSTDCAGRLRVTCVSALATVMWFGLIVLVNDIAARRLLVDSQFWFAAYSTILLSFTRCTYSVQSQEATTIATTYLLHLDCAEVTYASFSTTTSHKWPPPQPRSWSHPLQLRCSYRRRTRHLHLVIPAAGTCLCHSLVRWRCSARSQKARVAVASTGPMVISDMVTILSSSGYSHRSSTVAQSVPFAGRSSARTFLPAPGVSVFTTSSTIPLIRPVARLAVPQRPQGISKAEARGLTKLKATTPTSHSSSTKNTPQSFPSTPAAASAHRRRRAPKRCKARKGRSSQGLEMFCGSQR